MHLRSGEQASLLKLLWRGVVPVQYQIWGVRFRCAARPSWVPRQEPAAQGRYALSHCQGGTISGCVSGSVASRWATPIAIDVSGAQCGWVLWWAQRGPGQVWWSQGISDSQFREMGGDPSMWGDRGSSALSVALYALEARVGKKLWPVLIRSCPFKYFFLKMML